MTKKNSEATFYQISPSLGYLVLPLACTNWQTHWSHVFSLTFACCTAQLPCHLRQDFCLSPVGSPKSPSAAKPGEIPEKPKKGNTTGRPFVGNPISNLGGLGWFRSSIQKKPLPIENLQHLPRPPMLRSAVWSRASLGNFMAGCWTATCSSGRIYCGHNYIYMYSIYEYIRIYLYVLCKYVHIYIYVCVRMYIYICTNHFGRAKLKTDTL